jgi:hypothetical protein
MPHAPCPMPHAQHDAPSLMPHGTYPMPTPWPMPALGQRGTCRMPPWMRTKRARTCHTLNAHAHTPRAPSSHMPKGAHAHYTHAMTRVQRPRPMKHTGHDILAAHTFTHSQRALSDALLITLPVNLTSTPTRTLRRTQIFPVVALTSRQHSHTHSHALSRSRSHARTRTHSTN